MTEYLKFWSIPAPVFTRPVQPSELYISPRLAPLLEKLTVFCRHDHTLMLLTGACGAGKSTIAKWLYETLPLDSHEVLLTSLISRETRSGWLTKRMAEFMGVTSHAARENSRICDGNSLLREVADRLDELVQEERKLIVLVDGAHRARTSEAFDEVLAYIDLQDLAGHCLSFVLLGHHDLTDVVDGSEELSAKVGYHLRLEPFNLVETKAYIRHRLKLAKLGSPFDEKALERLQEDSGGHLAIINKLAEHCLVEAYQRGQKHVNNEICVAASSYLRTSNGKQILKLQTEEDAESVEKTLEDSIGRGPEPEHIAPTHDKKTRDSKNMTWSSTASKQRSTNDAVAELEALASFPTPAPPPLCLRRDLARAAAGDTGDGEPSTLKPQRLPAIKLTSLFKVDPSDPKDE